MELTRPVRIAIACAGCVAAALAAVGCAYDNGNGGTTIVPPSAALVAATGTWWYVPCISNTGCDVNGVHYPQGGLVPNPEAPPVTITTRPAPSP